MTRKMKKEVIQTIIYGAIGSFIAAVVFHLIISSFQSEFLNKPISRSWLITVMLFFALIASLVFYVARKIYLPTNRVFIVSSSFTSAPFFSELIRSLVFKLEQNGYTPVVLLPQKDFDDTEVARYVSLISTSKEEYLGGMFVHSDPVGHYDMFRSFASSFGKPIIFVDSVKSDLYDTFPDNCSFVGFDNTRTGVLAAEYSANILKRMNIHNPKILVLASHLQKQRQLNFIRKIDSEFVDKEIVLKENGEFNRRKAHKIVYDNLKHLVEQESRIYDLVFCTNDEMALGALSAITDLKRRALKKIAIVGVDGISQARREIDRSPRLFKNTVNQNPDTLAENGVDLLLTKLRGERCQRTLQLEPEMYVTFN